MGRLIDADALMEKIKEPCKDCTQMDCGCFLCDQCEITEEAERIEDAPTVDAVRVVRCKDCSHSDVCKMDDGDVRYCHIFEMQTEDDYYCADGERRSECD